MLDLKHRIEQIAVDLTRQRSITETSEEQLVSEKVHHFFSSMPYYQKRPEDLYFVPVENDPWGRKSVIAILRGQKTPSDKTVVLIGHTDTVGTSDYGTLQPLAHQPYQLTEAFQAIKETLPSEVREDLESGDYLFGRGLFDMKTGDAIIMAVMEHIIEHIDTFTGNIVFMAVCDEEANSKGMLTCVPELVRLREDNHFDYQALINTDYMTEEFPGDEQKYVYVGTVGKLMPSFFIVGKETHVGEAFNGFDPNQLAAELTRRINMNTDFCDNVEGEVTLPPMSLKQRDLKTEYSVQTAKTAHLFFNYATHISTPDLVLKKMRQTAEEAFGSVIARLNDQYKKHNELTGRTHHSLPWEVSVLTYEEMYAKVEEELGKSRLKKEIDELSQMLLLDPSIDEREFSLKIVERVHELWSNRKPVLILYYTPPYYPHIYIEGTDTKERKLLDAVAKAVDTTQTKYEVVYKKFFPYISDLSYAAAPKDEGSLSALSQNMPGFGVKYVLPLKEMQSLQLPVVDIGPFGKDAHRFTERIEKKYSFEVAPQLVYKTILHLLED